MPFSNRVKKLFKIISNYNLLIFYLKRTVRNPKWRIFFSKTLCYFLPKSNTKLNNEVKDYISKIRKEGILSLERILTDDKVKEIINYLHDKELYERYGNGRVFTANNIPVDCHTAAYSSEKLVYCPHILELANNNKILEIVEGYLGAKPTISSITSWWSVPGRKIAKESELFHRDMDDLRFIKFFIYLTDVNIKEDAAHIFVKGSHDANKLTKLGRYTEKEVIDNFGEDNIMTITGKAGTGFLEDTFGIHRGNISTNKKRLLLQFEYSLNSIGTYQYNPLPLKNHGYDSYINRLFIKK